MPSTRTPRHAGLLQVLEHVVRDRADMAVGPAGGHHHVVADRGLAGEIDGDGVLGLHVVEAREDQCARSPRRSGRTGRRVRARAGAARESAVVDRGAFPFVPFAPAMSPGDQAKHSHAGSTVSTSLAFRPGAARSAVEDRGDLRPCRKTQAGGSRAGKRAARHFREPEAAEAWAAGDAGRVEARTAAVDHRDRTVPEIPRQSCQRWKLRRLSAPMIQTNRTPGQRRDAGTRSCRRCSACR